MSAMGLKFQTVANCFQEFQSIQTMSRDCIRGMQGIQIDGNYKGNNQGGRIFNAVSGKIISLKLYVYYTSVQHTSYINR